MGFFIFWAYINQSCLNVRVSREILLLHIVYSTAFCHFGHLFIILINMIGCKVNSYSMDIIKFSCTGAFPYLLLSTAAPSHKLFGKPIKVESPVCREFWTSSMKLKRHHKFILACKSGSCLMRTNRSYQNRWKLHQSTKHQFIRPAKWDLIFFSSHRHRLIFLNVK